MTQVVGASGVGTGRWGAVELSSVGEEGSDNVLERGTLYDDLATRCDIESMTGVSIPVARLVCQFP